MVFASRIIEMEEGLWIHSIKPYKLRRERLNVQEMVIICPVE